MKIGRFITCAAACAALSASPVYAKDKSGPTGLALQQIQARDFETTSEVLFPAVVTVLQDAGYRISEADKSSGFVAGVGSAEQKLTFNWFWGIGKKKTVPVVSAFIEQRGPSLARLRLNFVMSKSKSRENMSDETPISDPAVYKDAFEKIEKEVFVRQAMNAPAMAQAAKVEQPPAPSKPAVNPAVKCVTCN